MATSTIVVLSSSPLPSIVTPTKRQGSSYFTPLPSSPALHSIRELLGRPGADRKAAAPSDILPYERESSPITPWTLPPSAQPLSREYEVPESRAISPVSVVVDEPEKTKKTQKRKNTGKAASDGVPKKPRAPRKKSELTGVNDGNPGGTESCEAKSALPPKKPRMTKSKDDGQTKIKTGKISKPRTSTASKGATKAVAVGGGEDPNDMKGSLGLEKVVARKRQWTPIEGISHNPVDVSYASSASSQDIRHSSTTLERPRKEELTAMIRSFSYSETDQDTRVEFTVRRGFDGEAATKKRKIELVRPLNPQAKARIKKSPNKKTRTITGKATEQFVVEKDTNITSLLPYLELPTVEAETAVNEMGDSGQAEPPKPIRRKSSVTIEPAKAKATVSKSKKKAVKVPALLPPEEALKMCTNQDILFGTSSQLAREESPTFMREMQKAIKASELTEQPGLKGGQGSLVADATLNTPNSSTVSLLRSSKSLWSVAARDGRGATLDAEIIDLSDTPKAQAVLNNDPFALVSDLPFFGPQPTRDDGLWTVLDDQDTPRPIRNDEKPALPPTEEEVAIPLAIPRSLAEATLRKRPKNLSLPTEQPIVAAPSDKPNFEGYSTTKLAKAIAGYGFKPVKNRDTMIKLLEQCYDGKARLALQSLPTNVSPTKKEATMSAIIVDPNTSKSKGRPKKQLDVEGDAVVVEKPPRRPRGRPKKNSLTSGTATALPLPDEPSISKPKAKSPTKATKATKTSKKAKSAPIIDDISDPDPLPTPSPPRRRRSSQTTTLPLSPPAPNLYPTPSTLSAANPTSPQSYLFSKITEAIITFPISASPSKPSTSTSAAITIAKAPLSWHEKILLYDPIVLEDLAAWLNTVGLGRVGVDEEVSAGTVREWCEGRGICCLWRVNLNGGERARW